MTQVRVDSIGSSSLLENRFGVFKIGTIKPHFKKLGHFHPLVIVIPHIHILHLSQNCRFIIFSSFPLWFHSIFEDRGPRKVLAWCSKHPWLEIKRMHATWDLEGKEELWQPEKKLHHNLKLSLQATYAGTSTTSPIPQIEKMATSLWLRRDGWTSSSLMKMVLYLENGLRGKVGKSFVKSISWPTQDWWESSMETWAGYQEVFLLLWRALKNLLVQRIVELVSQSIRADIQTLTSRVNVL